MEVMKVPFPAGASADPRKSLEDAVKDFQAILTDDQRRKLSSIGAIRDPDTVMIFTAQLDRENQSRKGRGIACRLASVLQSVQRFSTVVDTFVSSRPEIAALVWGSIKLAMLIAVNYTSYFEALSVLFMDLSKQCPRFAEYQALYATSTGLQIALCDFHASIIRCCRHVVEAIQRPWQKQLRVLFQPFEQEFEPDVNDIRRLGEEVKHEINLAKAQTDRQDQVLQEKERAAASKQRLRLNKFMSKMEGELDTTHEMQVQRSARRSIKERQRLLESLSSYQHTVPFREARKKHRYSTAEWIFTTPEFSRWYDGTGSTLLWCSGKIGSGKTILCANVINHVLIKKGRDDRVAFFFLQYDNSDSLMAETMIRSIIRQSIDATTLAEDVEQKLRELDQKPFVELQDWTHLLQQSIEHSGTFFIFIDGLDECDAAERRALLDALSSLATTASGLRIFIASRDSVSIDLRGRFSRMEHVPMAPERLISDIHLYVQATIEERKQNGDLVVEDPCLENDMNTKLTQHADGMFVWVTYLLDELCHTGCDDDIRQSLDNLPKNLEDTFARALSRILCRQKMVKLVQRIFRWVAAAKRPLTLDELREAVSIHIGRFSIEPGMLVREMSPIVLWCENLLQVSEEEAPSVQFAHSTIRDFITGESLPPQLADFHVDLKEADHFAGEICVTYLHLNDFKTTLARRPQPLRINPMTMAGNAFGQGPMATRLATRFTSIFGHRNTTADLDLTGTLASYGRADGLEKLQQKHPFLKYATKHWISHSAEFQRGTSRTWSLWHAIVTSGHSLARVPWEESTFCKSEYAMHIWSHQMHHYALLRHACSFSGLPEPQRNRLMWVSASEGDSKAIAIFLDAECLMYCVNRALKLASGGGHLQVIEQLLEAGANVNAAAATIGERTALQAASEGGHLLVVERLLEAGADVNAAAAADDGGRTALQAASEGGHLLVVERLLEARANINAAAAAYGGRTALQAASEGGHLPVVERLLEAGADVNAAAARHKGRTALQAASEGGHLPIVERLLEAGADVNAAAATYGGRTALQVASEGGHLLVVERLLEARANINAAAAAYGGRTALQAASEGGHLPVVERLLEAGADVNAAAAAFDGRTALQVASGGGHLPIVERLLEAGADVNAAAATNGGRTALQAASEGGHLLVVERLFEAGANVNAAATNGGRTALQAASEGGHLPIVERLLEAGADVNAAAAAYGGRMALQTASEGGHLPVVERLLEAGADVNAAAARHKGRTALQAASEGGHLPIVERLLEAEADVNAAAATYGGRTALQTASGGGHLLVVERLLEAGADINAAATFYGGRTALQAASEGGHLLVVERLFEAGANVNAAATNGGRTALQAASEGGHLPIVERLLEAGAKD